jgi:hypothetical protein
LSKKNFNSGLDENQNFVSNDSNMFLFNTSSVMWGKNYTRRPAKQKQESTQAGTGMAILEWQVSWTI